MKAMMAIGVAAVMLQTSAWRSSTSAGLTLNESGGTLHVVNQGRSGVDLWREDQRGMTPPYAVKATLHKLSGRQHEGYGFLFGGRNLGTDSAQYSYVMIRGDGAVLVKKRDGAATPVVRDWQVTPAVHQDDARSTATNTVEVRVTAMSVIVLVNDTEVARLPSGDLYTSGLAGLRISHQMAVDVAGLAVQRAAGGR